MVQGPPCHLRYFQVGLASFLNMPVHCGLWRNSWAVGIRNSSTGHCCSQSAGTVIERGLRPRTFCSAVSVRRKAVTSQEGLRSNRSLHEDNTVQNKVAGLQTEGPGNCSSFPCRGKGFPSVRSCSGAHLVCYSSDSRAFALEVLQPFAAKIYF
jgi:hypothetical protein